MIMSLKNSLTVALMSTVVFTSCQTSKTETTSGIHLENMDTTAVAGDNFYRFATAGWRANHPLTDEYSRFGSFDMLAAKNEDRVKELIGELASKPQTAGTEKQKIADVYHLVMDSVRLNKEGVAPLKADLAAIDGVKSKAELLPLIAHLDLMGVFPYFNMYVTADMKNSKANLFHLSQGGLSLGQKEYYLDDDETTKHIREAFKAYVVKMFELVGNAPQVAEQKMKEVMAVETKLAKASRSKEDLRDDAANYHKMSVAQLATDYPEIDWAQLFDAIGVGAKVKEVTVGQPEALAAVASILKHDGLAEQKAYLEWQVMNAAATCLNDEMAQAHFDFYSSTMKGIKEMKPRWKRAVNKVNGVLGQAVGKIYVKQYFSPEAKERMEQMVKNLQTALADRIEAQTWMSDTTKARALEKLNAFYVKIGYPNEWKDYKGLVIDPKLSYWENMKHANEFEVREMLDKVDQPVDREEWFMTPQTINAYYNPTTNEICFPAGILQYPFFDMNADDAFNYGAIGVVIGHEMTHGFDDQGRHYDKDGNFSDWWTKEDAKQFNERAKVMADFFSNIEVLPGLHGNGHLTLGENLADHGGLNVSYQAFENATKNHPLKVVDGFTPEQRFFLAYANVWGQNIRDKEIRVRTKSDPHALGKWRVNGALPHIAAWYKAWNVGPKDSLYVAPEKRVDVW